MKMKTLRLKNFRGYRDEMSVEFCDLTTFVGKNDIGKSTILEALDIFLNEGKGIIKMDKEDINKRAVQEGETEISFSISFEELPNKIIIDATNETTLEAEYLTNINGQLEIIKKYPNAGVQKVFIKAYHPTNTQCNNLLQKKDTELRKIIESNDIICDDKTKNAVMREAIWNHYTDDLQLSEIEIDITKGDTKPIWEKLQRYLPTYSLFQSDRKNSDGDSEVQDPLKEAVKQILMNEELRQKLNDVAAEVEVKLKEVSDRTLEKLREMNPDVANSLNPVIPPLESLKWTDVFKNVSISGDEDIPINKRGSGVKRLILLNFFRAEAERRRAETNSEGIIYAIEEPETSQHTEHQKMLINAFIELASSENTQIIITTHSANCVKELEFENLRLISTGETGRVIENISPMELPYPSLNEVNFLAFSEVSEEYHNELYGFIEAEEQLVSYKSEQPTIQYKKIMRDNNVRETQITLTEYIRHQIHHPENTHNPRYSTEQLKESICLMRYFINENKNAETAQ
ncbi:ATP-binding protein [Tissierella creatinophila]|uniref:DNA replication and repair protein RecF n=1 Tax=Tissierella creatinophila DSM 6911 TaxID=1123403 RepID=A0A1U7M3U7_TISCR|nr:ATP-binding protein [Tissierella creatinophila]OLS01994.1 DNA replication and repair protein RecF [Tissierella creatinophila DSM 6911]